MEMKARKVWRIIAVTSLLSSIVLAGCSSSSSTTDKDSGSSSGKKTVVWWTWNPGKDDAKDYVAAFEKSHPKIHVEVKSYQYNDYVNALKLSLPAGEGPDVFGVQAGVMQKEFSSFMEDLTPNAEKAWGNDWESRFYELGLKQIQEDSKTPALPFFVSAAGYIWYNNTILQKYGLKPPTTISEWKEVAKTLQSKGVTPFIQGAKDSWINFDTYIALANAISPGKIYDAEAGKVSWTDPDLVKAMSNWKQLFDDGIMQKGALGVSEYPDSDDLFHKGEAAMITLGTWNGSDMSKTTLETTNKTLGVTETYEFLPAPFPGVDSPSKPQLFGGPDVSFAINKSSSKKDASWEFIKWLDSDDAQKILASKLNIPAVKGINLDDSNTVTDAQKTAIKQMLTDVENAVGKREFLYPELQTALADALQNVATGKQSPEKAMKAVDTAFKAIQK
jgi:raffinose/stachyose/melibiose transport system substrate-binding protein